MDPTILEVFTNSRRLIDMSADGVCLVDSNGDILLTNRSLRDMVGQQVVGLNLSDLDARLSRLDVIAYLEEIDDGAPYTFETQHYCHSGALRDVEVSLRLGELDKRRIFFVSVRDLSARKRLLQEAERSREASEKARIEAERLAEAKSQFLASMSHEIRTPINAIVGLANILQKQDLPGASLGLVEKLEAASQGLLGVINNILDFSKLEAGGVELVNKPIDLNQLMYQLGEVMAANLGDKPVELIMQPVPDECSDVMGDPQHLMQVLTNLTANAIKFTRQGSVEVRISCRAAEDGGKMLTFAVSDTGIGMDADAQALIFDRFSQADGSINRQFGGTGLGLAIARQFVELMGGELQLQSQPGKGSRFWFELPMQLAEPARDAWADAAPRQVLLADDNALSRVAIEQLCASLAWPVQCYEDGKQLLEAWSENPQWHNADTLLIVDYEMSPLNGVQTLAKVKKGLSLDQQPMSMLISAHSMAKLVSEIEDPDIRLLTKPASAVALRTGVASIRASRQPEASSAVPEEAKRLLGLKLLVVDDAELNLDIARLLFTQEGAQVTTVSSGYAAIDWLQESNDGVHLVLMDMQMPDLDGLRTTRLVHELEGLESLPVLALTANVLPEHRVAAEQAGMVGYITKPIEIDDAVAQIRHVLGRAADDLSSDDLSEYCASNVTTIASALPKKPSASASAAELSDAAESDQDKPLELLDNAFGLRQFKGPTRFAKLLESFLDHYQDVAWPKDDPEALRVLAHRIKGSSGALGLRLLSATCERLEAACKAGQSTEELLMEVGRVHQESVAAIENSLRWLKPLEPAAQ